MAGKTTEKSHSKTGTIPEARPKPGDEAAPGTPGSGEGICPKCGGSGRLGGGSCPHCRGTGKITAGIGGA